MLQRYISLRALADTAMSIGDYLRYIRSADEVLAEHPHYDTPRVDMAVVQLADRYRMQAQTGGY